MNQAGKPTRGQRVALYARVSSDKQEEEGTIDSQLSALREHIAAAGETLEEAMCFVDDGFSGTTLLRPALERLRDQAAAGAIDRLYVLAPDRLARRHVYQMVLVEELQACQVEIVFVNRPLGTTPEDQLLLQVQGVVAEYERAKILERTRRGRLYAARCGRVSVLSRAPYGYRYIDKHSGGGSAAYEVIDDEAQVVRQIFSWTGIEGCSLNEVVRRLQRLEIRTRTGRTHWNPATIWGMLTNPAYKGQAAFGKTRLGERRPQLRPRRGQPVVPKEPSSTYKQPASAHIPIMVPALVEADLFAAVQERLAENGRYLRQSRRGARYLLQGLLVCDCCGYALCGRDAHLPTKEYTYYSCLGRQPHRFGGQRVCDNRAQRTDQLDAAVWNDVYELLSEPERLRQEFDRRQQPAATGAQAEEQRLRAALTKVQQSISRLIDAYADGLVEAREFEPRVRHLKERLARLNEELRAHQEQRQNEEQLRLVCSHFNNFAEQIKAGLNTVDWTQRREILRALVKRVEVGRDSIRIVYRIPHRPFADGPRGAILQHCWRRHFDTDGQTGLVGIRRRPVCIQLHVNSRLGEALTSNLSGPPVPPGAS
jgi:site-specific DNA recombinase